MWQIRIYNMRNFLDDNYESMKLVKEVEGEPNTDCIMNIDGKLYRWCMTNPKEKVIGVEQIFLKDSPKTEDGAEFRCPYCGEIDYDAWEMREDEGKTECGSCNSEIEYSREYEITYTVTPIKRNKIIQL